MSDTNPFDNWSELSIEEKLEIAHLVTDELEAKFERRDKRCRCCREEDRFYLRNQSARREGAAMGLETVWFCQDCMRGIEAHLRMAISKLRHFHFERATTRDEKVPVSADDPEMENGWQCIPVRPTDEPDWYIIDDSHDYKTVWGRWQRRKVAGG
jgi:hypothetical protein